MKSIQALREQKQELARQARNQLAEKGDRAWTKEDQTVFDKRSDEIEAIEKAYSMLEGYSYAIETEIRNAAE